MAGSRAGLTVRPMITDRNIVCIASNWFEHPTSKHHVMRSLAGRNHIVWVNYHASRRPSLVGADSRMILRRLRQIWSGPRRVAPAIDVLSPLLVPLPASRAARFFNARATASAVRAALRRLPRRPAQLWLFTPDAPELIDLLRPERVVYYCVDEFSAFTGYDAELMNRLERRTLERADVVITTSDELQQRIAALRPDAKLVPHGVDVAHFAAATTASESAPPRDIDDIPAPVLGYFGLISDYVDLELLAEVARRRPDWSLVLLGAIRCDVSVLRGLPNVHLLGGKPYQDLPAYCRRFDVGLIPFRVNRLTRAVNPIKLREYLAAGLPVVSTPLPAVRAYAPAVRIADTPKDFAAACAAALVDRREGSARERQELVRAESWQSRVETLSELVMGGAS
ncbi:MAG: glycosyltransferase family 1 protein [Planctomycetota bacterium]|nr:MAG: glycosyltransferase family 1 protein [Planctomycetota bacterium]